MIRIEHLNKIYNNVKPLHVLKDINLHIYKGEIVAIMGESGSGKSTLLNIIGLLDKYNSGDLFLDNELIKEQNNNRLAEIRNRKIGFVFQSFDLIQHKTALENVALPLMYQRVPKKIRNFKALEYLKMMNIDDRSSHLPNELSGGQKQRVSIARALISNPQLILADEPTGALDSQSSFDVMEKLKKINSNGITIVVVTHEESIAKMADRIILLKDGRIIIK